MDPPQAAEQQEQVFVVQLVVVVAAEAAAWMQESDQMNLRPNTPDKNPSESHQGQLSPVAKDWRRIQKQPQC